VAPRFCVELIFGGVALLPPDFWEKFIGWFVCCLRLSIFSLLYVCSQELAQIFNFTPTFQDTPLPSEVRDLGYIWCLSFPGSVSRSQALPGNAYREARPRAHEAEHREMGL
jgi:hypothetical protein